MRSCQNCEWAIDRLLFDAIGRTNAREKREGETDRPLLLKATKDGLPGIECSSWLMIRAIPFQYVIAWPSEMGRSLDPGIDQNRCGSLALKF
jgi:hypothetical protein